MNANEINARRYFINGKEVTANRYAAMKQTLKAAAAIIGILAAGLLFWKALAAFMWACYYAGIPM